MILRACAVLLRAARATALGARVLLGRGIHAAGSESDFDSGQMKITL